MTDHDIVARLRRIESLQAKVTHVINEVEDSDHPKAKEIAAALWEQCWFAASAEHVGVDYLNAQEWTLAKFRNGTYGGIISRRMARKRNQTTID